MTSWHTSVLIDKDKPISYILERWHGRLAQWIERCVDIAEVTGSNPVSPTIRLAALAHGVPPF